jgi:hypothetical protein
MTSHASILYQLTSGLMTETAIPTEYLYVPEISAAIQKYNWSMAPSTIIGWTTLIRVIHYSS